MKPSSFAFALEQLALALDTPTVTGEVAVGAHHAMTRDRDGQAIGRAGAGHGAHGPRRANAPGELGIRESLPGSDASQRLPDAFLKCRAADVERQRLLASRFLYQRYHLGDPSFELCVAAEQLGPRKLPLQLVQERLGLAAERDGAHAARGGRDQDRSQRALTERETD